MAQSNTGVQRAQTALQYTTPAIVLLYYLASITVSVCTLQTGPKRKHDRSHQITIWCINFTFIAYLVQCGDLVIDSLSASPSISTVAANINAAVSTLIWFLMGIILQGTKRPVYQPYLGPCLITLVFEIATFSLSASQHTNHKAVDYIFVTGQACRFVALLVFLATHARAQIASKSPQSDEESASLLGHHTLPTANLNGTLKTGGNYGSVTVADPSRSDSSDTEDSDDDEPTPKAEKKRKQLMNERLRKDGNWFTYLRGFSIFVPLVWPSKRPRLYFNMAGSILCVLCVRALQVLKPRQLGIIVNILASGSGSLYTGIGLYVFYIWMALGVGIIQACLWLPVEQYSEMQISTAAYNHIMDLSSDFHDNKQSGELYRAISQGSSISSLLDIFCFQFGPMGLDLVVGYGYLYYLFGPYMALLAGATTIVYLYATIHLNSKLSKYRRKGTELSRKESQLMYDSVGSWTTVSYFNRSPYEKKRYEEAISLLLIAEQLYHILHNLFSHVGNSVVNIGLWGALCLAAYQVTHGMQSVGTFVTLLTYWSIFSAPLKYLAYTHKHILRNLVDAEQLLQIFQTKPKIVDGSSKFVLKGGAVEFKDVSFSYDGTKQIINGISFSTQPGRKIALVGETGGGKSTLLKLLFRFYDAVEGSVLIDDQDVRDVTVESLRSCIGVVPQDPSMFNDTIMNNVRYSRLEATDEEVMEACKAAAVHDKILSFTDGYSSKVGEKGVKLSGGELQRLAIARALLKDPAIILLDEATSSVDTDTESRIQKALDELTKGRTTFTVAHRLSTVLNADVILVVKGGKIVEQGPPNELLAARGEYYGLWCKQVGITSETLEATEEKAKNGSRANSESEQAKPGLSEHKVFRPDAPEFIPRHLQSSSSLQIPAKQHENMTSTGLKAGSSQQQEPTTGKATKGKGIGQGKRQRAQEDADATETTANANGGAGKLDINKSDETESTTNEPIAVRKRSKFNRIRRRGNSKSETAASNASIGDEHVNNLTATPEDSGEGSSMQNRRVSAPSTSTVDGKTTGQALRNGRKHGRNRNKKSPNTQSAPGTWSGMPAPSAAAPTPTGTGKGIANGEGESKGGVRFAQDS
ncbi:MAG: hypothetical protein Q9166_006573 [cf. Caloplaca sp. 2 TL-2023]